MSILINLAGQGQQAMCGRPRLHLRQHGKGPNVTSLVLAHETLLPTPSGGGNLAAHHLAHQKIQTARLVCWHAVLGNGHLQHRGVATRLPSVAVLGLAQPTAGPSGKQQAGSHRAWPHLHV